MSNSEDGKLGIPSSNLYSFAEKMRKVRSFFPCSQINTLFFYNMLSIYFMLHSCIVLKTGLSTKEEGDEGCYRRKKGRVELWNNKIEGRRGGGQQALKSQHVEERER